MTVPLFFRKLGEGDEVLFILHGLFGSSDNWQSLGKEYARDFTVYLVDQRNHGRSPHHIVHTYESMAEDLEALMESEGISQAHVLGHSMGGKTAICFAQLFPRRLNKLLIADMGAKAYTPHHDHIFEALNAMDVEHIASRAEAEEKMSGLLDEDSVKQFLLKNLYREKDGSYHWRFNLPVLEAAIPDILKEVPPLPVKAETLFIRGGLSRYITDEDLPGLKSLFPAMRLETIENAGHWLHAEDPDAFYAKTMNFLS